MFLVAYVLAVAPIVWHPGVIRYKYRNYENTFFSRNKLILSTIAK